YKNKEYYIEEEINGYERVYIKTPKYKTNGIKRLINQIAFAYYSYKRGKEKIATETTPEVIIGSSVHLFTGISAYLLAKKANAKFIFEIRDVWPQTLIDLGTLKKNSIVTKLFQKMEKYLYKKADLIISVLPNAEEHITKYNINKDKIVHLPNEIDINNHEKALKTKFKKKMEKYLYKKANLIISVLTNAEEHITKYNINKDKIVHLPNGIDINNHEKALQTKFIAKEAVQYFREKKDSFIVTYTGAHGIANGLDTLLTTANLFKKELQIQFLLVDDGKEKENHIQQATDINLDNVTFLNRVEKNQVNHILKHSDICLFHLNKTPVFKYGISSNKLFDYMISGKPMIFA